MRDKDWIAAAHANQAISLYGMGWREFVDSIQVMDRAWRDNTGRSVLGTGLSDVSWERTISDGYAVVRKPDWLQLDQLEADVLIGASFRRHAYEFLGNNTAAGSANHLFRGEECSRQRQEIHSHLLRLQSAPIRDFPKVAANVLADLLQIDRIGVAVATRLIALARPDCGISLNNASRSRLAKLCGLPQTTLGKPSQYRILLERVAAQPWHAEPEPKKSEEARIWRIRAALFDCLVYDPGPRRSDPRVIKESIVAQPRGHLIKRAGAPDLDPLSVMARFLREATVLITEYLEQELPALVGRELWEMQVINNLTDSQRSNLRSDAELSLKVLDLAALLRVFDKNWFELAKKNRLPWEIRNYLKELQTVRNRWSHQNARGVSLDDTDRDLSTLQRFLPTVRASSELLDEISHARKAIRTLLQA